MIERSFKSPPGSRIQVGATSDIIIFRDRIVYTNFGDGVSSHSHTGMREEFEVLDGSLIWVTRHVANDPSTNTWTRLGRGDSRTAGVGQVHGIVNASARPLIIEVKAIRTTGSGVTISTEELVKS